MLEPLLTTPITRRRLLGSGLAGAIGLLLPSFAFAEETRKGIIVYNFKEIAVTQNGNKYIIHDYLRPETKERDKKFIIFTYLMQKKISEYDPTKLKKELEELESHILRLQSITITESAKDILIKATKKANPTKKAIEISKQTIDTLIELGVNPKLQAQGAVIADINWNLENYRGFLELLSQKGEYLIFNDAADLANKGRDTEPLLNQTALNYLKALEKTSNPAFELDEDDVEILSTLHKYPELIRILSKSDLIKKIQNQIKGSQEYQDFKRQYQEKTESWDQIKKDLQVAEIESS